MHRRHEVALSTGSILGTFRIREMNVVRRMAYATVFSRVGGLENDILLVVISKAESPAGARAVQVAKASVVGACDYILARS